MAQFRTLSFQNRVRRVRQRFLPRGHGSASIDTTISMTRESVIATRPAAEAYHPYTGQSCIPFWASNSFNCTIAVFVLCSIISFESLCLPEFPRREETSDRVSFPPAIRLRIVLLWIDQQRLSQQ
jgi:hypothetical protein